MPNTLYITFLSAFITTLQDTYGYIFYSWIRNPRIINLPKIVYLGGDPAGFWLQVFPFYYLPASYQHINPCHVHCCEHRTWVLTWPHLVLMRHQDADLQPSTLNPGTCSEPLPSTAQRQSSQEDVAGNNQLLFNFTIFVKRRKMLLHEQESFFFPI